MKRKKLIIIVGAIAFIIAVLIGLLLILNKTDYNSLDPSFADNVDYSVSNTKENSVKTHTVSDIENAFIQSVIKNSMDEIKPYLYPKADEILKNAYKKGEDVSVLADLHCVIDDFYYDEDYPLGNDVQIEKIGQPSYDEITTSILNDIYDIDNSVKIQSIEFLQFRYHSETYYSCDCVLIIVQTDNGAFLLAIDT